MIDNESDSSSSSDRATIEIVKENEKNIKNQ